jgi:hypothetical protein
VQEAAAGFGDLGDGALEGWLVGPRGLVVAADFADELKRGGVEFIGRRGLADVVQAFYAAAHFLLIQIIVCSVWHAAASKGHE